MKIKDIHLNVLSNYAAINENFYYDGNFTLKTKNKTNDLFVECELLDFIGIPFAYYDISQFLKFMKTADFTISNEKIVIKNENGIIRFKMSNSDLIKSNVENKYSFDNLIITKSIFSFNVQKKQITEMLRIAASLDCDRLEIYSINNKQICLFTYQERKRDVKNYSLIIDVDHEHNDNVFTMILDRLKLVDASDYQFEVGLRINQSGMEVPLTKIKAFIDKVEVKYLIVMKAHKNEVIQNDKE
jgi:hypothetical protein